MFTLSEQYKAKRDKDESLTETSLNEARLRSFGYPPQR